jgi:hypothetical protein
MEQEKETKNGKRKIFQKSELEATWRRYETFFQVGLSNVENREEIGIQKDVSVGYNGLT